MNFDKVLKKMRSDYLKELPSKIKTLEVLVHKKDYEGLESFYHKLKGSGASYGFKEITQYGATYEPKAKDKTISAEELQESIKVLTTLHQKLAHS